MTNSFKLAAATLALVATPALVSADSLAVSLSATFGDQSLDNIDLSGGDGATCPSGVTTCTAGDGGDAGSIDSDVTSGSELDVANETVTVSSPTSLSVAAATGDNAAASTAGGTVEGTADVTFANAGGGSVSSSEQVGSFTDDNYTATVSFDDQM